ncbi:MAG: FAD-binding oxidoreductase [Myxococcota bacterium]|nr:FAD-binding oxidoreductase [Myxococcota bacterium]
MSERSDVVILGAGVVGLSTAWQLARRGAKVLVLDQANPGGQGSRAAAGVGIPSLRLLDDDPMVQLTSAGGKVLVEDLAALGLARRPTETLRPVVNAKVRGLLEAAARRAPELVGRWLPSQEVAELEPALAGGQFEGAFLCEHGGMVDIEAYIGGLLAAASRAGAQVKLGQQVVEVREEDQGVVVRCATATWRCDRLVVAAGAWAGQLAGLTPLPVRPLRGQMLRIFHPEVSLSRIVSGPSYLAPWRGGEIVVGATEEDAGFAPYSTPEGLLHLTAVVARLAPRLREARFVQTWAGLRAATPNGRPMIGRYPATRRVFLGSGHGGQGILCGGLTGRLLVDLLDGESPELLRHFAPTPA